MTRKDYVLLAAALKQARESADSVAERYGIDSAIDLVAAALASDNSRFDYQRFYKAAGIEVV